MFRIISGIAVLCLLSQYSIQAQSAYTEEVDSVRNALVASAMQYKKNPPLTDSDTSRLSYFPIREKWKVQARFDRLEKDTFIKIPTTAGTEKIFKILGVAHFQREGIADSLLVYQPFRRGLKDYYFIPFKDATSGITTYGGGRYLEGPLEMISEEKARITLDFNMAYNPWCAYNEGYFCPLPPPENELEFKVTAGEQKFERDAGN
jgi:hypothetical protein